MSLIISAWEQHTVKLYSMQIYTLLHIKEEPSA